MSQVHETSMRTDRNINILWGFMWAGIMLIVLVIGINAGESRGYKAGYERGYKDALYKRPVSNDLEMVCAGLWIGQENLKYQQREMKK
jgi:hypothetical protein